MTPLSGGPKCFCLQWPQMPTGEPRNWPPQSVSDMNSVYRLLPISSPEAHPSLLIHNKQEFQLCVVLLRTGNYQFPLMQTSCIQQIMILSSSVFKLHLSSSISPSITILTCLQRSTFKGFKPSASFCTPFISMNSQGLTRDRQMSTHVKAPKNLV